MKATLRLATQSRFLFMCLVGLLATALLATTNTASATSFGMFGTSPLTQNAMKTVSAGDSFVVDIGFQLAPGDSISSYSMSVEFDTDLLNELDVVSVTQPATVTGLFGGPLTTTGTPTAIDSTGGSAGSIMSFAGSTAVGSGIVNSGATAFDVIIGSITFMATSSVATDGPDAFTGFFAVGDQLTDNSGIPHTHLGFGDLSVNVVPEPTSVLLLALGGLMLVGRRRQIR